MPEPKKRTPNLNSKAGTLATALVKARERIQRHRSALTEAEKELAALETKSDPQLLAMARALLGATLAVEVKAESEGKRTKGAE